MIICSRDLEFAVKKANAQAYTCQFSHLTDITLSYSLRIKQLRHLDVKCKPTRSALR